MQVHLVDGTYELFRHHFAVPSHVAGDGVEVAATRAVLGSMLRLVADDEVIASGPEEGQSLLAAMCGWELVEGDEGDDELVPAG